jgi:glutamyl/glutaminyl-tRNA synthetase
MQQPDIQFNKTRIAPTPSGFLHLGNVLSFALTAALANKTGAKILLRIDDLDRERIRPEYVQDIFDTLNFLEIPYHEGPRHLAEYKSEWSQLYRLEMYHKALERLKMHGHLFACICSRTTTQPCTCYSKHFAFNEPGCSWKLKTDDNDITIKTYPNQTISAKLSPDMQNFMVRKKDGFPAYQLASVCDDLHFGIDLVVRGQDLFASTLAQLQLAQKLRAEPFFKTTFYHHPLLMASGNQKLSKSAGDTSIKYLREQGKSPADIYTMIVHFCGKEESVNSWQQLADVLGFDSSRKDA